MHVATEGPVGVVARAYALRHHVPLVTSFHTQFPQYARHYGATALEPLIWRWLEWFHRPARLTHTPGAAVRYELVRRGLTQAVVWGSGVDTSHYRPTATLDWTPPAGAPSTTGGGTVAPPASRTASFFGATMPGTSYVEPADPNGPKWWQGWTNYAIN